VVRGLVLVDIGIGKLFTDAEIAELRTGLAKNRDATLAGWFGAISKPGAQRERLVAALKKLPDQTILGCVDMIASQPATQLHAPALVMASPLLLPKKKPQAEELAAIGYTMPVTVERFDHSMHWIFWDEPAKFVATLRAFAAAH
jgi:pimeloyl-ACP methyl ester carboxylesterase